MPHDFRDWPETTFPPWSGLRQKQGSAAQQHDLPIGTRTRKQLLQKMPPTLPRPTKWTTLIKKEPGQGEESTSTGKHLIDLTEEGRNDHFTVSVNLASSAKNGSQRESSDVTAADRVVHPESTALAAQSRIKIKPHRKADPNLRKSKRSRTPPEQFQAGKENGKGMEQIS